MGRLVLFKSFGCQGKETWMLDRHELPTEEIGLFPCEREVNPVSVRALPSLRRRQGVESCPEIQCQLIASLTAVVKVTDTRGGPFC